MNEIQEYVFQTFETFVKICEDNNLRYYMNGGSLIGTMRHRGFIPWDDDIDVAMPREDFNKLLKLDIPGHYDLCTRYNTEKWNFAFVQFVDLNIDIEIHLADVTRKAHICIDVFPIDGLPDNRVFRWIRVSNIMLLRGLVQMACVAYQSDNKGNRPWYEKIILNICRNVPLEKIIDINKVLDRLECVLQKNSFDKSSWSGNMLGRYRRREAMRTEWFGVARDALFEGKRVKIPSDSDSMLRWVYGDYMRIPPAEERESHGTVIVQVRT